MKKIILFTSLIFAVLIGKSQITIIPADSSVCYGGTIVFTANFTPNSEDTVSYKWNTELNSSSIDTLPTFILQNLTQGGSVSCTITVRNNDTTIIYTPTTTITVYPQFRAGSISQGAQTFCSETQSIQINEVTPAQGYDLIYIWRCNESAIPNSNSANFHQTMILDPEIYSFTREVLDGCGNLAISGGNYIVTVLEQPTLTLNNGNENQFFCLGEHVTPLFYEYGGGASYVSISGLPPGVNYNVNTVTQQVTFDGISTESGNFSFTVQTISNSVCDEVTLTGSFTVRALPQISISADHTEICEDESVTLQASGGVSYLWNNGLGTDATIIVNTSGIYTVTGTDANNCTNIASQEIIVHPNAVLSLNTNLNTSPDRTVCIELDIDPIVYTFGGAALAVAVENLPQGISALTNHNNNSVTISGMASESGEFEYSITTISAFGCDETKRGVIMINALPIASISIINNASNEICAGETVELKVLYEGEITDYLWSTGATTDSIAVNPEITTTYLVTVTDLNQCTHTISQEIIVHPLPVFTAFADPSEVCAGSTVMLTARTLDNSLQFFWFIDDEIFSGNEYVITPEISQESPEEIKSYTVDAVNDFGCVRQDSVFINVLESPIVNQIVPMPENNPTLLLYPNPEPDFYYQWYKNGEAIFGANRQFYYPANSKIEQDAEYQVHISRFNPNLCGRFSEKYIFKAQNSTKNGFAIAPNPTNSGNINLIFHPQNIEIKKEAVISLVNYEGKIFYTTTIKSLNEQKINIQLATGIYFVTITTDLGKIYTEKLIIK